MDIGAVLLVVGNPDCEETLTEDSGMSEAMVWTLAG